MKYAFTYLGIKLYFSSHDWTGVSILFENEFWQQVYGYRGMYYISSFGRIKSVDRKCLGKDGRQFFKRGRFLSPGTRDGYKHIELNMDGRPKKHYVHRLVCFAFLPNTEDKPQVNHKNCIRHDNRIANLEWITASENCKHPYKIGKHQGSSVTDENIEVLKHMVEKGESYSEISRVFRYQDQTNSGIYNQIRKNNWYRPFGHRTVSDEVVEKIREIHKNKRYGYKETANMFGIGNHEIVGRIVRGESYKKTRNDSK